MLKRILRPIQTQEGTLGSITPGCLRARTQSGSTLPRYGSPWEGSGSPFYKWGASSHKLEATGVLPALTTAQRELKKETLPGQTALQGHGFGVCLKWMTYKKNSQYHGGGRRGIELSLQGLWPVATSQGSRSFHAVCLLSPFPAVPPEGCRQIRHQPWGTWLTVESLKGFYVTECFKTMKSRQTWVWILTSPLWGPCQVTSFPRDSILFYFVLK